MGKNPLNLGYTFTDSFDSNTCDAGDCKYFNDELATAKVRVPRHAVSTKITHNTTPNLQNSFSIKFADETRDFGNTNNGFKDVVLKDFTTVNFTSNYKLFDNYNLFFNAINIFDESYEQALQYSTMNRTFNFGINRKY